MIAVIVQTLAGVLSAFMPSYPLFVVCKFVADVATGGTMLVSFVISKCIVFNLNINFLMINKIFCTV